MKRKVDDETILQNNDSKRTKTGKADFSPALPEETTHTTEEGVAEHNLDDEANLERRAIQSVKISSKATKDVSADACSSRKHMLDDDNGMIEGGDSKRTKLSFHSTPIDEGSFIPGLNLLKSLNCKPPQENIECGDIKRVKFSFAPTPVLKETPISGIHLHKHVCDTDTAVPGLNLLNYEPYQKNPETGGSDEAKITLPTLINREPFVSGPNANNRKLDEESIDFYEESSVVTGTSTPIDDDTTRPEVNAHEHGPDEESQRAGVTSTPVDEDDASPEINSQERRPENDSDRVEPTSNGVPQQESMSRLPSIKRKRGKESKRRAESKRAKTSSASTQNAESVAIATTTSNSVSAVEEDSVVDPNAFHQFACFPPEIRVRVYHFALPSAMKLRVNNCQFAKPGFKCSRRPPVNLRINRESRYEFLKFYKVLFQNNTIHQPQVCYFDPVIDTVSFKVLNPMLDGGAKTLRLPQETRDMIQKLEFNHMWWSDTLRKMVEGDPAYAAYLYTDERLAFGYFKNLTTLKLVAWKHKHNGLVLPGGTTSCEIDLQAWFEQQKEKDPSRSVPVIEVAPAPLKQSIAASDKKRLEYHLVPFR